MQPPLSELVGLEVKLLRRLGPEPFDAALTPEVFHAALQSRRTPIKAVLLILGAGFITVMVMWNFGFNLSNLLGAASQASPDGVKVLEPMLQYGKDPLSFVSLSIALIFGAAYTLWMFKRVYLGPVSNDDVKTLTDINSREFLMLALLAIAVLAMGVYPKPFTDVMDSSVAELLKHVALTKLN